MEMTTEEFSTIGLPFTIGSPPSWLDHHPPSIFETPAFQIKPCLVKLTVD
jgi:hypothetical protein